MDELFYTRHAAGRRDARRIAEEAVEAALTWGRCVRSHADIIYRIDRRTVASARRMGVRIDRFEGVAVVVTPSGAIRTVWRNRRPQRIRR